MNELVLECPQCGASALADDEFCESCGTALGALRDFHRHHIELDLVVAAGVSDRGRVHWRNEDALFVAVDGDRAVAIVCDGVSTSAAPQVAAQVAADAAGRSLLAALGHDVWMPREAIAAAVEVAAVEVLDIPWMATPRRADAPSCTLAAAVWDGHQVTIGWSGDSRIYWIGSDHARQLSTDHSWAQVQIDAGRAVPDEAIADLRSHAITRWLGAGAPVGAPAVASYVPTEPGMLLLCSDGLWNRLAAPDDLVTCGRPLAPIETARRLVALALHRESSDNVTVVAVNVDPAPE